MRWQARSCDYNIRRWSWCEEASRQVCNINSHHHHHIIIHSSTHPRSHLGHLWLLSVLSSVALPIILCAVARTARGFSRPMLSEPLVVFTTHSRSHLNQRLVLDLFYLDPLWPLSDIRLLSLALPIIPYTVQPSYLTLQLFFYVNLAHAIWKDNVGINKQLTSTFMSHRIYDNAGRASYNNALLFVVKRLWFPVQERPKVWGFGRSGKLSFEMWLLCILVFVTNFLFVLLLLGQAAHLMQLL